MEPIPDDGRPLYDTHTHILTNSKAVSTFSVAGLSSAATFPEELGMSVPLIEEEQKELLYVPLDGEWGCRTRAEECERIIKAIDQLCTLGTTSSNPCENNRALIAA